MTDRRSLSYPNAGETNSSAKMNARLDDNEFGWDGDGDGIQ